MSSTHLPRPRGSGLSLPPRRRARPLRPCRPPGPGLVEQGGTDGRFAVAMERLAADSVALYLRGELDYAAVGALDGALRRLEAWMGSVIVDTEDVSFVDLSVVSRLAVAHERIESVGGGLIVVNPPKCLLRVLELVDGLELPVLR